MNRGWLILVMNSEEIYALRPSFVNRNRRICGDRVRELPVRPRIRVAGRPADPTAESGGLACAPPASRKCFGLDFRIRNCLFSCWTLVDLWKNREVEG